MTERQAVSRDRLVRKRVAALERRHDWLRGRIESYRGDGDPSRDLAEAAALAWALRIVRAAEQTGVLDELEAVGNNDDGKVAAV